MSFALNNIRSIASILQIMLGSLGSAFGAVVNFWLGANKDSDRTKELLVQAAPVGP